MKKSYPIVALAVLFGLNLLHHRKEGFKVQQTAPLGTNVDSEGRARSPATDDEAQGAEKEQIEDSENLSWLKREAQHVGRVTAEPSGALERIRERAGRLTEQDRQELKTVAVDPQGPADERFLAVFVLSESPGGESGDQLQEISQTPIAKTGNDREYSDELIIRMKALEASVKKLSPSDAQSFLQRYLSKVEDPQLAKHARYLQK